MYLDHWWEVAEIKTSPKTKETKGLYIGMYGFAIFQVGSSVQQVDSDIQLHKGQEKATVKSPPLPLLSQTYFPMYVRMASDDLNISVTDKGLT